MKGTLYSAINRQASLSAMKCLADVTSEKKRQELEREGYAFGFTAKSWAKRFHGINPRYILCTKSEVLPSELYYYDSERYICFAMHIFGGQILEIGKRPYEEVLREEIQKKRVLFEQHEYLKLLLPIASEQTGNIVMAVLRQMLEHEEPNPDLFSAAISVYTLCDCGAQVLGTKAIERLSLCKSEEQKSNTAKALADFPDEITVYRGEASESTPHTEACSWTTSEETAFFFAGWRSDDNSNLFEGKVSKSDVIEYITDRNEHEIIVPAGKVYSVKRTPLLGLKSLRPLVQPTMFDDDYPFPECSYPSDILADTQELYSNIDVEDHGVDHPLRVTLLSSFLYRLVVLEPLYETENHRRYYEALPIYEALIRAAEYHDSGRWDNMPGDTHGAAGYERYQEDLGDDEVVKFLTTYHCKEDAEAHEYWESRFSGADKDFIWTAYQILRDADALDRVRFGRQSEDYLKVSLLRLDESKRIVPAAMQLAISKLF